MSFISSTQGIGFRAGHFLANDEECTRVTMTIPANHAEAVTKADGTKYVPAGAIINDKGILYEDIDVTNGDAPGSVVVEGTVYDVFETTPEIAGITVVAVPTITRPY